MREMGGKMNEQEPLGLRELKEKGHENLCSLNDQGVIPPSVSSCLVRAHSRYSENSGHPNLHPSLSQRHTQYDPADARLR